MKIFFTKSRLYLGLSYFRPLTLLAFLTLACFTTWALADKITFHNGRHLNGLIIQQTPTHITLELDAGTISLPKSRIKSITKSNHDDNVHKFVNMQIPVELQALNNAYARLKNTRFYALRAKNNIEDINHKEKTLLRKRKQLEKKYAIAKRKVNAGNPRKVSQYNKLIGQQNKLHNKLTTIATKIQQGKRTISTNKETVADYQLSLTSLKQQRDKIINNETVSTKQTSLFLAKFDKNLQKLDAEFSSSSVPHITKNGHMFLKMRLNNRNEYIDDWFLLDTGATSVLLTRQMARRLHLDLSSAPSVRTSIADGSVAMGKQIVLDSMSVGDIIVHQVQAIVLLNSGKNAKGLLGMSFLDKFDINIDVANDKLTLKRFNP